MPWQNDDEALMRDINHPAHTSGGREGMTMAAIICIASVIFFSVVEVSWLPLFWKVFLTLLIAALCGRGVGRWIARMHKVPETKSNPTHNNE